MKKFAIRGFASFDTIVLQNWKLGALALSLSLSGFFNVQAGWPEFRQQCHVDKMRNNAWPQPFRGQDAMSVVAPFEVMKQNGWREFTTISSCFFDGSNQLTDAGQLKIQQSLTTAPPNRRAIYVLKGATPEQTSVRVEAVEVAVSGLIPIGDLPPIYVTEIEPPTSAGAYQTLVNRALSRTTPTPRVPPMANMSQPAQTTVAPNASQASGN